MGSIKSKPKTVTVVQPVVEEPVTATKEKTAEEIAKEQAENVLRRARSAIGTVVTGFRGVLTDKVGTQPQRKSLLGE